MKESSIRDAKTKLTSLIHEAESGQAIRLTRHGKPVAVLVSNAEYENLQAARAARPNFIRFLHGWRREMIAKGIAFETQEELSASRDRRPGRNFTFEK